MKKRRHPIEDIGVGEAGECQLRRDLKDSAVVVPSTCGRGAIEIAVCVEYQVTNRILSVASTRKIVKRTIRPAAISRRELENGPKAIGAITERRAIEITSRVRNEVALGSTIPRPGKAVEQGVRPAAI